MTSTQNNFRGAVTMLCAVSFLSLMDAGLKQLSAHYPPLQVCAMRSLASWPFIAAWVIGSGSLRSMLHVRWAFHLFRGTVGVVTLSLFVFGIRQLPLTTAYTLFFVAPLIIASLSALVLGETVDRTRWIVIGVGFVGVLIALHPTGEGFFSLPALAIVAGAIGYSTSAITVRVLGRTDSTQAMVFWTITMMGFGGLAIALPNWVSVAREDWLLIAGIGLVGGLGQYALTDAFRRAEASVIAPIEYTALAWSVTFDAFAWKNLPGATTWIGAAIIVAAGLYLVRRERMRATLPEASV